MDKEKLRKFWSDPEVWELFDYPSPESWEGRDPAEYYAYRMDFSYELQLCHSLGIDSDNFLSNFQMDRIDDEGEVTRDATE